MSNQEWSLVNDFPDYEVSICGQVRNIKTGFILKPIPHTSGYIKFSLYRNTYHKRFFAHRLVAYAFIPNPKNYPQVNHKNGIKNDNRIDNLEWCTPSLNSKHSFKIGLQSNLGEKNPAATLTDLKVKIIKSKLLFEGVESIAKEFGVTNRVIKRIKYGQAWTHVPEPS